MSGTKFNAYFEPYLTKVHSCMASEEQAIMLHCIVRIIDDRPILPGDIRICMSSMSLLFKPIAVLVSNNQPITTKSRSSYESCFKPSRKWISIAINNNYDSYNRHTLIELDNQPVILVDARGLVTTTFRFANDLMKHLFFLRHLLAIQTETLLSVIGCYPLYSQSTYG